MERDVGSGAGRERRIALRGEVDLLRREFHGLGEIAAGVMQQAAKRSGLLIFRPFGSLDKGRALLFIEKEALSVSVKKVCSGHIEI